MATRLLKRENIVVPFDKYTDNRDGQEKTQWRTIGELVTFQHDDGSQSQMVKLWTMPGVNISVFEKRDPNQPQTPPQANNNYAPASTPPVYPVGQTTAAPILPPEEEISVEDIPF